MVEAVQAYDRDLTLLLLPGSRALDLAEQAGLRGVGEAFADRAYTAAGTLVPRDRPGAVLHDPDQVAERVLRLVTEGVLAADDGTLIRPDARSICLHGDTPGAVAIARSVSRGLAEAGVRIEAFA